MSFIKNLNMRPSCFKCPAKSGKSNSDITLADYWGVKTVHSKFNDNNGTSLVFINTKKGLDFFSNIRLNVEESSYQNGVRYNSSLYKSPSVPKYYDEFWHMFAEDGLKNIHKILEKMEPTLMEKFIFLSKVAIKKIFRVSL